MDDEERERHTQMIDDALKRAGYEARSWGLDEDDDRVRADLGRFVALEDDEDEGIFEGDLGVLYASVVGAQRYGNERVWFGFMAEGTDVAVDVRDLSILEPE
jgi:hypothetical protein